MSAIFPGEGWPIAESFTLQPEAVGRGFTDWLNIQHHVCQQAFVSRL